MTNYALFTHLINIDNHCFGRFGHILETKTSVWALTETLVISTLHYIVENIKTLMKHAEMQLVEKTQRRLWVESEANHNSKAYTYLVLI